MSFGELSVGEMSVRRIVLPRNCPSRNYRGNDFGELSVGEKFVGEMSVGELSGYRSNYGPLCCGEFFRLTKKIFPSCPCSFCFKMFLSQPLLIFSTDLVQSICSFTKKACKFAISRRKTQNIFLKLQRRALLI